MQENSLFEFIDKDHFRTLFPINSMRVLSTFGLGEIKKFINDNIFEKNWLQSILEKDKYQEVKNIIGQKHINIIDKKFNNSFLVQPLVYASKDLNHLRQTFLLDPISQIFLYDFVYRNKAYFKRHSLENRKSYGYYFKDGKLVSNGEEYQLFKEDIYEKKSKYNYMAKLDIANCFNNIYHHDLVSYISRLINQRESQKLGSFLRDINFGRSTSCVPQGLIPTKIIGNSFLTFIEKSRELKSEYMARFMDDIFLFSDDEHIIRNDVIKIQQLIGEKGLSLNEEKSQILKTEEDVIREIEEIKKELLQKRATVVDSYTGDLHDVKPELTVKQETYLKEKLHDARTLQEDDMELILNLLSTNEEETIELVELVIEKAPHLTKNLYHNINRNFMYLDSEVITTIKKYINEQNLIHEYQLFWLTKIIVDFTNINESIADLLLNIYNHGSSTSAVKCVILEVQENSFGLLELKKKVARGSAPEMVISSLVGLISHEISNRNQTYDYVARSNPMMEIYIKVLKTLDEEKISNIFSDGRERVNFFENNNRVDEFFDLLGSEDQNKEIEEEENIGYANDPFVNVVKPNDINDDDLPF
ncbi:antiviral reverse transcriptase Drt5 [Salipaludibacillus aurantiacus]|uniref:Reverse transcriptase (RNA-dependent DNA polymerase) n=1 Tax=Salipaludibacillus aurantiacus TaxID=1601833 RepID=A0A1H9UN91_9BACI|nr:antiviral reverse transcriptase Drt5 [Salipaludibacillus aurantiacus]SES10483.1 Reverse transcriptase (RNA-dependent DNA polymerase) [Salipaludibacillus aurantiacus]